MEYLHNGFTLELTEGAFPLSTDSIALCGFVRLPKNARVLDLGSGCGTLGLMLCASNPTCHITGVELSSEDHTMALHNAAQNGICHRLNSICGDLRRADSFLTPGSFDVCVTNPPYFSAGAKSLLHGQARHNDSCPTEDLFRISAKALRYGGDLFLVHKPQMLSNLCYHATASGLEPKRLLLLRHDKESPISLVLIQCRKGGKPGLSIEESFLHEADGSPSSFYRQLYHL